MLLLVVIIGPAVGVTLRKRSVARVPGAGGRVMVKGRNVIAANRQFTSICIEKNTGSNDSDAGCYGYPPEQEQGTEISKEIKMPPLFLEMTSISQRVEYSVLYAQLGTYLYGKTLLFCFAAWNFPVLMWTVYGVGTESMPIYHIDNRCVLSGFVGEAHQIYTYIQYIHNSTRGDTVLVQSPALPPLPLLCPEI